MSSVYKKSSSDDLFGTASFGGGGGGGGGGDGGDGGSGSRTCRTVVTATTVGIGARVGGSRGGAAGQVVGDYIADRVCEPQNVNGNYHGSPAQRNDFHNAGTPNNGPR